MRRRGGWTLLELMVYTTLGFVVISVFTVMVQGLQLSQRHVGGAMADLEIAGRFLRDVKEDLRRARSVEVKPARLQLKFHGGAEAVYQIDAGEGTVRRTGDGPAREYLDAFREVSFAEPMKRVVRVDVELRKHNPDSPYHPRISAAVFCRGREE